MNSAFKKSNLKNNKNNKSSSTTTKKGINDRMRNKGDNLKVSK